MRSEAIDVTVGDDGTHASASVENGVPVFGAADALDELIGDTFDATTLRVAEWTSGGPRDIAVPLAEFEFALRLSSRFEFPFSVRGSSLVVAASPQEVRVTARGGVWLSAVNVAAFAAASWAAPEQTVVVDARLDNDRPETLGAFVVPRPPALLVLHEPLYALRELAHTHPLDYCAAAGGRDFDSFRRGVQIESTGMHALYGEFGRSVFALLAGVRAYRFCPAWGLWLWEAHGWDPVSAVCLV